MHLCCSLCCSHAGLEELLLQRLSASVVASLRSDVELDEGSALSILGSTRKQLRWMRGKELQFRKVCLLVFCGV